MHKFLTWFQTSKPKFFHEPFATLFCFCRYALSYEDYHQWSARTEIVVEVMKKMSKKSRDKGKLKEAKKKKDKGIEKVFID